MRTGTRLRILSFMLFFGLLGLFFVGSGIHATKRAHVSLSWPSTEGVIRSAGVEARSWGPPHRGQSTHYYPVIKSRYSVAAKDYICNRLRPEGELPFSERADAEAFLKRHGYEVSKPVIVYYNPGNPSDAVLRPGESRAPIHYLLAVLFGIPAGVLALVYIFAPSPRGNAPALDTWRERRKRRTHRRVN